MSQDKAAYIAIGGNLGDPLTTLNAALDLIDSGEEIQVFTFSPWYQSTAVGPGNQPDYINGVIGIDTDLTAPSLLKHLQSIENHFGRVREQRWGARTLDLDILWYKSIHLESENLKIPHPRIKERNFVLFPWRDIAPELLIEPGLSVSQAAERVSAEGIRQMKDHYRKVD